MAVTFRSYRLRSGKIPAQMARSAAVAVAAFTFCILTVSATLAQSNGAPVSQVQRSGPVDALGLGSLRLESEQNVDEGGQRPAAIITDARLFDDGTHTTLELDINKEVAFSAFVLDAPPRLVIDLPAVDFRIGDDVDRAEGLISAWRRGLYAPGQSRIVVDLTGPATVTSADFIDAQGDRPARLSLVLRKASAARFEAEVQEARLRRQEETKSAGTKGDRLPIKTNRDTRPLVILDPGHGGIDTGTVGDGGTQEKDVVLAFGLALRDALEAGEHYAVQMTRDTDIFIPLDKRVEFARSRQADLFISIHADSVRQDYVRGASVYTVSRRASDDIARELAEKENRSDMLAGVTIEDTEDVVADILVDLMRRETKTFSVRFADVIVEEMRPRVKLVSNPHRYAGFRVLRAPDVPSVLVELGFLSNSDDEELLNSDDWQAKAIESLEVSIDRFFGNTHARTGGG